MRDNVKTCIWDARPLPTNTNKPCPLLMISFSYSQTPTSSMMRCLTFICHHRLRFLSMSTSARLPTSPPQPLSTKSILFQTIITWDEFVIWDCDLGFLIYGCDLGFLICSRFCFYFGLWFGILDLWLWFGILDLWFLTFFYFGLCFSFRF